MTVTSLPPALRLLLEQHLERQALDVCRPATFLEVVKAHGLPPTMAVQMPRGRVLTLRASKIFGARLKMLATQDLGEADTCLSVRGAPLISAYREWLTTAYTPRYRFLSSDTQQTWLAQIASLVVVRHLMEAKYACWLTQGRQCFADPWVGSVMGQLHLYHRLPAELARLINHLLKEPAQRDSLIQHFFMELDVQTWKRPFVQSEPLPPLPEEVSRPYLLPPLLKEYQEFPEEEHEEYPKGKASHAIRE